MTDHAKFVNVPTAKQVTAALMSCNERRPPSRRQSNYLSGIGDICERRLVYNRVAGEKAEPIGDYLAGIFETGTRMGKIMVPILNAVGEQMSPSWEILERERHTQGPLCEKYQLSGMCDGIRHVATTEGRLRPYNLIELKSMNSNLYSSINDIDDLWKVPWAAKYADQVLAGMFFFDVFDHPGWLILVDKGNWFDITIIEIPPDMSRMERLLQRAGRINDHVANKTLPEQINRPDICVTCQFRAHCSPVLEADPDDVPRVVLSSDESFQGLHESLQDHLLMKDQVKEANANTKRLKARLVPGQRLVCGELLVDWKMHGKGWRMIVKDVSLEASKE